MEFTYIQDGIDAVIIDNFYSEDQLKNIMSELKCISQRDVLTSTENLLTAEIQNSFIANKTGVFLESIYENWQDSPMITHAMENFIKKEVRETLEGYNNLYRILYFCDRRSYLLSYYENGGYYAKHTDLTIFTILNWFNTDPKNFTGGDMKLFSSNSKKTSEIEFKHNRVLLIPGCTPHEVTEINSNIKEYSGDGRYCNAIFCFMTGLPAKKKENI
jgi:hypothetical protein